MKGNDRPFLGVLNIAHELIQLGVLHKDPKNSNNILVYRQSGKDTPEGWYSENIHEAMSETFHDKESLASFLQIAKEMGVDADQHFKEAREILNVNREICEGLEEAMESLRLKKFESL